MELSKSKHIHMVGIGGIGMSGLAQILIDRGIKISGSDIKNNNMIRKLRERGCKIAIGHAAINASPDAVIRSFSIRDDNPEIAEARKRNIPIFWRMEMLRSIFEEKNRSIAITGTHGKTTTTAMLSYILDRAGLSPTVLIGGEHDYFKGNAKSGRSDIFVSEVDESDGYFSGFSCQYSIITNIEKEHMEYYADMKKLLGAFSSFAQKTKRIIFYSNDDLNVKSIIEGYDKNRISVGFSPDSDFSCSSFESKGFKTEFICTRRGKKLGKITLRIPGRHNALNALMAISCSLEFGIPFFKIKKFLNVFKNAKRRFEVRGKVNGVTIVEDYAHHPTEIKSVIDSARKIGKKKIIAVFQPHRYSRTFYLKEGFGSSFSGVDELILTDIYSASEAPVSGGDLKSLYSAIRRNGMKSVKVFEKKEIPGRLKSDAKPGDIILVLGAGDINGIIPEIKRSLKG